MIKKVLCLSILLVTQDVSAFVSDGAEIVQKPSCGDGSHVYRQKNGPFALLVHCEQALGRPVNLVYYSTMGADSVGMWKWNDRIWREKQWADDVFNFAWIGTEQLVVTNSSGVFVITMPERKVAKIFTPTIDGPEISIDDFKKGVLYITEGTEDPLDKKIKHQVRLPKYESKVLKK